MRLSKYHDKKPIIENISLSYFYGAKIGVLGLNGAGKSTLLRIMAGERHGIQRRDGLKPGLQVWDSWNRSRRWMRQKPCARS